MNAANNPVGRTVEVIFWSNVLMSDGKIVDDELTKEIHGGYKPQTATLIPNECRGTLIIYKEMKITRKPSDLQEV